MAEQNERDFDSIIDVEALTVELKEKMSGNLTMPEKCSIFKIPTILSRHSPNAFTPNQFSFGPFHHHNPILKSNQNVKSKYLLDLISRYTKPTNQTPNPCDPDRVLRALTEAITHICAEARRYYAGPIKPMTMAEFVEVLVLDGCFIVELFRKKAYHSLKQEEDPIFSTSFMLQFLWHDLVLLENQLPWIVLEKLFDSTITSVDRKPLVQLTIEFFDTIFSVARPPINLNDLRESKHILDLLRNSLAVSSSVADKREIGLVREPMPSATILEESGIKVRRGEYHRSILDVQFNHHEGVLEIPPLLIHDATETVFRNVICLELCCPNYDPIFISYALLLGNLINTTKDIEILCKSRALLVWSDIQGAEFFNKLFIGSFLKDTYHLELTNEVNRYCKRGWARYRTVFIRYYFNNPWAWISLTVAAFLAICSFFQTLYTINNHLWAIIFLIVAAVLVACAFLKTLFTIGK